MPIPMPIRDLQLTTTPTSSAAATGQLATGQGAPLLVDSSPTCAAARKLFQAAAQEASLRRIAQGVRPTRPLRRAASATSQPREQAAPTLAIHDRASDGGQWQQAVSALSTSVLQAVQGIVDVRANGIRRAHSVPLSGRGLSAAVERGPSATDRIAQ
uniref:Uncharacterized protein n=1 Tax=Haptolina ericina TaxID=156174 RepID=A0A7S3F4I1_9EUKA